MMNRMISPFLAAAAASLVAAGFMAGFTSLAVLPWLRANTAGLTDAQLLERAVGITWVPSVLIAIACIAVAVRWTIAHNYRVADANATLSAFPPPPARQELHRSRASSGAIRALYGTSIKG